MLRPKESPEYVPVRPYFNVVVRPKPPVMRRVEAALRDVSDPVIERYAAEYGITKAAASRLWDELVRFLFLTAANPIRRYGLHGPIDAMWHNFILHTRMYAAFCEKHLGQFMHHHPCRTVGGTRWESRYLQFLFDYRDMYGHPPPNDLWPIPDVEGIDATLLPRKASNVTPGHVKVVFEKLNGSLPGTALGKTRGHKMLKRRKSKRGGSSGTGRGSSDGGADDGGGCGGGGCGG